MKRCCRLHWIFVAIVLVGLSAGSVKAETTGDVTGDEIVDVLDVVTLIDWWMQDNCGEILNCFGVDSTGPEGVPDGVINFHDFASIAANWLVGVEDPIEEPPFPLDQ